MAWIRTVRPEEAEGIVKEEYARTWGASGEVPEVISVFSLRPDLLQARVGFAKTMTFGGSGLGRYREELIALSISQLLGCKFWGIEHAEFLRKDGGAELDLAVAVSTDWRRARLAPADHAMLEFGEKLTLLPSGMKEEDVAVLRRHGFEDREILSITLAAAYRNFITRLADALGVELRSSMGYAPEILHAFGVAEHEVGTTLYGDRLTATDPGTKSLLRSRAPGAHGIAPRDVCWIDTTPPDASRFAELCDELARLTFPRPRRHLALAFGLRPEALESALAFGRLLGMGGSGLGQRLEAIVGLAVAATLWVPYMGVHHAQAFLSAGASREDVEKLVERPAQGALTGREREVARFCEKMARLPNAMARSDVEALRAAGFGDRDIVTIAASAAYESFLCGIAAGLGVRLEEAFAPAALKAFEVTASA